MEEVVLLLIYFMRKVGYKKGFTLIELLVAITVFVIFLGGMTTAYMSIVKAQLRSNEVRKMYSEVRGFMDFVSDEIRSNGVDYECYVQNVSLFNTSLKFVNSFKGGGSSVKSVENGGVTFCGGERGFVNDGFTDKLFLISKDGGVKTVIYFEKSDGDEKGGKVLIKKFVLRNGVWGAAAGYLSARDILSDDLVVRDFKFSVFPDVNPYSDDSYVYSNNATQFQPKVTLFFGVENASQNVVPFKYDFQTSISSRVYSK